MNWQTLETLARVDPRPQVEPDLVERVKQAMRAVGAGAGEAALTALAEAIRAPGTAAQLLTLLAASTEPAARRIALELTVRLPKLLHKSAVVVLPALLRDKRIPREVRLAAVAVLVRAMHRAPRACRRMLRTWIAGKSKTSALELLHLLAEKVGRHPALDGLCTRLEASIRLRCPRCQVQLRRPEMVKHLWDDHGLLLQGRRVRAPWRLVESWIEAHRRNPAAGLLARCRALAQRLDPDHGLGRVYALILKHGIADEEALDVLRSEAALHHTTLCPACYTEVPHAEPALPWVLSQAHGRLTAHGYRVQVSEAGLMPWLEVATPRAVVYRGREPGRWLTRKGATQLLAGPPVLAALALALFSTFPGILLLPVVTLALALAALAAALSHFVGHSQRDAQDRALDYAWSVLVRRLHADGFSPEDSAFAAGLALASQGHGRPSERRRSLAHLLDQTEAATLAAPGFAGHLAALWRLAIEDAAAAGQDPVPLVADRVSLCLDGRLPLAFAERLLAGWESALWTRGNLARLRVLLCERAFGAGFEVRDLVTLGLLAPALGDALVTADVQALAQLRLLWSLRPQRPWDQWGQMTTAFELAATAAGSELLGNHPDLLLAAQEEPPFHLCGRGIWFQETWLTELPRSVEVRANSWFQGNGFDVVLDRCRFRFRQDPSPWVGRLEWLFHFCFGKFLPEAASVSTWRSPGLAEEWWAREAVECPHCRHRFLPRTGEVGLALEPPHRENSHG
jgi:hypothetical protein